MKAWIARYWPSAIVSACVAYVIAAFVVTLAVWAFFPGSTGFDGYLNTIQLLFPGALTLVLVNLLGPKLGLGLALMAALLVAALSYWMNRRSLQLGIVALGVYLALTAWLVFSRDALYALAGITQP
jgi:hypothetical protein